MPWLWFVLIIITVGALAVGFVYGFLRAAISDKKKAGAGE